ncbi:helix-turn-helix transcriptional regulator [Flavobacterium sp. EDS]|nr:helix-turn-helix transcriptional regulator [Flavobacterium sp. EDS]MCD0476332.1 helix-turn-helix transcriptional regulator [Flavobacterium sp. EDS]
MDSVLPEFEHTYSLKPYWQQKYVDELGCTITNEKVMHFPKEIVDGTLYFTEISPDVSVVVIDAILQKEMRFTRLKSEEEFWIIYYDLSDNFNSHVVNDVKHRIGYTSKLGFGIVDSQISSSYDAKVGDRAYSLRLFIKKDAVKAFFEKEKIEKGFKNIFDNNKKKLFFYGHIDSRSKVLLHDLKQYNMESFNYEFLLKNATYTLLGYFYERLRDDSSTMKSLFEKDVVAVMKSQDFLLSDLLIPFPGIIKLAEIANMSVSKFSSLYKNIYGKSPALFFKIEKLELANELLAKGDFSSIGDLAYTLGYSKVAYFSSIYKNHFGVLPDIV